MRPVSPTPGDGALTPASGPLDLLCEVPVPLRMRFADELARRIARHCADGGDALSCRVPMGQGGPSPFDRLRLARAPEAFPHMLVSARHGNAFNRRFHAAHVASGAFASAQPEARRRCSRMRGWWTPRGGSASMRSPPS